MLRDQLALLPSVDLFSRVMARAEAVRRQHPPARVISLGVGDVSLPLAPAVVEALHRAVSDMGRAETFRGYGPEPGYVFLRELIAEHAYRARGLDIEPDEVFVSDGSKCDATALGELFAPDASVAVGDPTYPVYVESAVAAGRAGPREADGRYRGITYLPCAPDNGFQPGPPPCRVDLVYLCSPNNPTGTVFARETLGRWVEYARRVGSVLIFDAAYEAYVRDPRAPRSIYEISGAREVAVELRSFSKTAGFTGIRCAFAVIPRELRRVSDTGALRSLHGLWWRRLAVRFNGVAYIVQCAAAAVYSEAGTAQVRAQVDHYLANAALIRRRLERGGLEVHGGEDAPYVWMRTPRGLDAWTCFERLLEEAQVVVTPGCGYGPGGEGFVRLSAFASAADSEEAVERILAADIVRSSADARA